MNTRQRLIVATAALWVAGTAFAQSTTEPVTPAQGLTRAEVLADLSLWKRAGAGNPMDDYDISSTQYQQALARYQQLRSSPAYAAEVKRIADQRGDNVASLKQAPSAH